MSDSLPPNETGRRVEIEVTPEMIEAVMNEVRLLDPLHYDLREVAEDAIKAVLANLPPYGAYLSCR